MTKKLHLTILAATFAVPATATAITIGSSEARSVATYTQTRMNAISQYNIYFAHASVGDNMVNGLATLHSSNPTFYKLTSQSVNGTPPATTAPGVVYEFQRGNPNWTEKLTWFSGYLANGWRSPKVSLVMNKFCWIDQTADVTEYINANTALEASYPGTKVVYVTMPLTPFADYENYQRNLFNQALRNWANVNNRLLLDVADIEAHAPDGTEQLYAYNGTTCQRMYDGYTNDGGHPALNGASERLAMGIYAITAALDSGTPVPVAVPAMSKAGWLAIALAIGLVGLVFQRRRGRLVQRG